MVSLGPAHERRVSGISREPPPAIVPQPGGASLAGLPARCPAWADSAELSLPACLRADHGRPSAGGASSGGSRWWGSWPPTRVPFLQDSLSIGRQGADWTNRSMPPLRARQARHGEFVVPVLSTEEPMLKRVCITVLLSASLAGLLAACGSSATPSPTLSPSAAPSVSAPVSAPVSPSESPSASPS